MELANCPLPLATIFDTQVVRWVVWTGLVLLTVSLLVLMRTRWGQSQPLGKCIVLSLLAHLLLGIYTTTVDIVRATNLPPDSEPISLAILDGPVPDDPDQREPASAWESFVGDLTDPDVDVMDPLKPDPLTVPDNAIDERVPSTTSLPPEITRTSPVASADAELPPSAPAVDTPVKPAGKKAEAIDVPPARRETVKEPVQPAPMSPAPADQTAGTSTDARSATTAPPENPLATEKPMPPDDADALVDLPQKVGSGLNIQPLPAAPGDSGEDVPSDDSGKMAGTEASNSSNAGNPSDTAADSSSGSTGNLTDVPSIYQLRVSPERERVARGNGATPETEAAVRAALKWLAEHQSRDGRWDPRQLEAGREVMINGHDRRGAGTQGDTGITGLALLAFLAAGHTHQSDDGYQANVQRGLDYLVRVQSSDGNLGGSATLYEKMYCHAIATFALSEAYAMTRDERLQTPVRRAVSYTVASQHAETGGWRYQPNEPGDTSQLGWQLMALKSAELAGIGTPEETRQGMIRFLKSVSSGKHGGLASYRPGHRVSRAMTAEALVCRQFLGMARTNPAGDEAGKFLLEELPGTGQTNLYYWYYATLGIYQLQGEHWQRWNEALQGNLLKSQRVDGKQAGSWDPDPVWGAYGGRVYSTALSALCLEVYYRFLPLYVEAASRDKRPK